MMLSHNFCGLYSEALGRKNKEVDPSRAGNMSSVSLTISFFSLWKWKVLWAQNIYNLIMDFVFMAASISWSFRFSNRYPSVLWQTQRRKPSASSWLYSNSCDPRKYPTATNASLPSGTEDTLPCPAGRVPSPPTSVSQNPTRWEGAEANASAVSVQSVSERFIEPWKLTGQSHHPDTAPRSHQSADSCRQTPGM